MMHDTFGDNDGCMPPSKPQKKDKESIVKGGEQGLASSKLDAPPPATSNKKRVESRRVDHTYRDYSEYPLSAVVDTKKAKAPIINFPAKLHQILSTPDYECAISWMPHGRAWRVNSKEIFIREIAPNFFGQSKYESFTRQLNGWGFKKLYQSGNDYNAYYHEQFLRGLPHLTALMRRVPPNQGKLLPFVEGEPNFYDIDRRTPLVGLPTMTLPNQGQQSHNMGGGGGYGAPSQAVRMPFHGHIDDSYAQVAAYNSQMGGGYYPHPYSTQYGYNPYYGFNPHGQYPHYYSYHHGHDVPANLSQEDNADPAITDSLIKAVGGEDSVKVEDNEAASDSSPSNEPSAITCVEQLDV